MAQCNHCRLTATLSFPKRITGRLSTRRQLVGILSRVQSSYPIFAGPYQVTPAFEDQTLETNNKLMTSDVEVEAIYVSSTPNPAGGNTIYIGGIIEHADTL